LGSLIIAAAKVVVILLMLSMGLRMTQQSLTLLWRRPRLLVGSIAAAFLVVPAFTYLVIQVIPLSFATKAGLWVIAITPGAPMIHTAASRRGLGNPDLAASFQVTVALLVIVFAPLWLLIISGLTGLDYRMNPLAIMRQVSVVQLVPILLGLMIHRKWPAPAERIGNTILRFGTIALVALALVILAFLSKHILNSAGGWRFLATALVALSAIVGGYFLTGPDLTTRATIANANAQRNPGLALAIAAWNLPEQKSAIMLVVVVYVLVAAVVEAVYTKICVARMRGRERE
jgi:bile acid:Na+ symporter, BASS family